MALLTNGGARVPRFSLDRIIERHGDCPDLRLTLLEREDLPLDVRQVLLARLATALRQLIVSRDWMPPERADTVTRDARERATIAAAFEAPADSMPALVEQLIAAGELTPAFLIRAAASGQTLLFETALAALAGLPQARVNALIAIGAGGKPEGAPGEGRAAGAHLSRFRGRDRCDPQWRGRSRRGQRLSPRHAPDRRDPEPVPEPAGPRARSTSWRCSAASPPMPSERRPEATPSR